jgi:hypothetical protein
MSLGKKTLAILFFLPLFGGILGWALFSWGGPPSPWKSLDSPPSPAISLISIAPQLVIESLDGDQFFYSGDFYGWKLYTDLPQSPSIKFDESLCESVDAPEIEDVVDSGVICTRWGQGYRYTKYVILSDGTVWEWSVEHSSEWGVMGLFFYILGGIVLFLVIALIVLAVMHFVALLNRLEERSSPRSH